jgi:hypothetical protein
MPTSRAPFGALLLLALVGCGGRTPLDVDPDQGAPPGAASRCASSTPTAYLLDDDSNLYSVDPATLATALVASGPCASAGAGAPFTMAVSNANVAYIVDVGANLFALDLATLACKPVGLMDEAGLQAAFDLAVAPGAPETMYYLGQGIAGASLLATSDLTSFVVTQVDAVVPDPGVPLEIKFDAYGRLFGLGPPSSKTTFVQIDPTSGAVLETNFPDLSVGDWALLIFEGEIYFFVQSIEYRYDLASHTTTQVGTVPLSVVGAGAGPCIP